MKPFSSPLTPCRKDVGAELTPQTRSFSAVSVLPPTKASPAQRLSYDIEPDGVDVGDDDPVRGVHRLVRCRVAAEPQAVGVPGRLGWDERTPAAVPAGDHAGEHVAGGVAALPAVPECLRRLGQTHSTNVRSTLRVFKGDSVPRNV